MKLLLKRIAKRENYTIGRLYIDGKYFSDTLEDTDRGLSSSMSLEQIKKIKIKGQTAIPTGTYNVDMNTVSPRFGKKQFYKEVCNGKVPRLQNVPGYEGILIHVGDGQNGARLTEGCLLVGHNKIVGGLLDGKQVFKELYQKLKTAKNNITITIE